ncbi:hypothetical protein F4778DRAFT_802986 [Xylariomycetidae sp. FL2044]|nr:hypothetical protein F4778DRAFT_802986 [Xylariomycetidae sp. FL2044]
MQFSFFVSTTLLSAIAAQAAVVTEDQPDGIYEIQSGRKRSTAILLQAYDASNITTRSNVPEVAARALPAHSHRCEDNAYSDSLNYEQALAGLGTECDHGLKIGKNNGFLFKFGSAITYVCSWGGEQGCSSSETNDAMKVLDGDCGNLHSGSMWMDAWKKAYGRGVAGDETCGDGWD